MEMCTVRPDERDAIRATAASDIRPLVTDLGVEFASVMNLPAHVCASASRILSSRLEPALASYYAMRNSAVLLAPRVEIATGDNARFRLHQYIYDRAHVCA